MSDTDASRVAPPRPGDSQAAPELFTFGRGSRPLAWFGVGPRRDHDAGAVECIFSAVLADDVLVLEGELDLATAAVFARALDDLDRTVGLGRATVDLRTLDFMDCTGLRVLLEAAMRARRGGGRLSVLQGSGEPARLLGVCGLDAVVALLSAHCPPDPAGGGI